MIYVDDDHNDSEILIYAYEVKTVSTYPQFTYIIIINILMECTSGSDCIYKDMKKSNESIYIQIYVYAYNTVMYTRHRSILFREHVYLISRDCAGIQ